MFVTTERLVWVQCVRSRIFRGSLQFASGFCSSPLAASPSWCCSHHVFLSLSFRCVIRRPIQQRLWQIVPPPSPVLTVAEMESFTSMVNHSISLGRVVGRVN